MIPKILKWIGIVLGSLIGPLVLAFLVLYTIGTVKWNKLHGKYDVPVETITIPTDQASTRELAWRQQVEQEAMRIAQDLP